MNAPRNAVGAACECGCREMARPGARFVYGHHMRPRTQPLAERFWAKVDKSGDCWPWVGKIAPDGYGKFAPERGRTRVAHRVAYELTVGLVPEGLVLDHLCRVRHCVNPAHLEPVTQLENMRRGAWAQRTHCPSGHAYTPENTRVSKDRKRACRACHRRHQRNYLARRAVAHV